MNSVIICEGSTDFILLQYYMQKVHNWQDAGLSTLQYGNKKAQLFTHQNKSLTIMPSEGSSHLISAFENILERNYNCQPDQKEAITKIAIITDRDEDDTEGIFLDKINHCLGNHFILPLSTITNNQWIASIMNTKIGIPLSFYLLIMVIPFTKTGAMETCLLNAISAADVYDKQIINDGNAFVQNADPAQRYLKHRRYRTKAQFHVYFCIRGPIEQSMRSQQILMNTPWENYPKLRKDFKLLGDL